VGLKLNGTLHLLAYADDINLLGDNIDTIKKNTETLICASKEAGLEINVENRVIICPSTQLCVVSSVHLYYSYIFIHTVALMDK
jgi:hypothetical protein